MTREQKSIQGVYVITGGGSETPLAERVHKAISGGAQVIQYRDKNSSPQSQLETARALSALCRDFGATFLINDSPELARDSGADGVHLGQGDGSVADARALLGPGKIVGVSTRTVEQALRAKEEGADYIGLGAMFPTGSKDDAVHVGVERLREVREAVDLPIVAIGGVTPRNASEVIGAGADAVAVISSVMSDPDPAVAARELVLLFNRRASPPSGRILTVAGSDSGGGAGIQADLKTITLLGGYGMSAITALTAQNTRGVHGIHPVPPDFVDDQIEAVLNDIGADTVKTGMLFDTGIILRVADAVKRHAAIAVVDPVMIAKGGAHLLKPDAVDAFRSALLPCAYLLTPNLPEAQALCEFPVHDEEGMVEAAHALRAMGARNVLIKGGHLDGDAIDILLSDDTITRFTAPRQATRNTHGTGCTFSAGIATFLAQGHPLAHAVERGKLFISEAIRHATPLGSGHGPVNHWRGAQSFTSSTKAS